MKKKLIGGLLTAAMVVGMNVTVFEGGWINNDSGWWYDNGNGTWPASSWQWIDGNNDGIAECYYFDQYGYCLMNTTTPGGYIGGYQRQQPAGQQCAWDQCLRFNTSFHKSVQ